MSKFVGDFFVEIVETCLICVLVLLQDDEYDVPSFPQNKRPGFTAPLALLNDIAQVCTLGIS